MLMLVLMLMLLPGAKKTMQKASARVGLLNWRAMIALGIQTVVVPAREIDWAQALWERLTAAGGYRRCSYSCRYAIRQSEEGYI